MLQKFIVYGLSFIVLAFSASPAFAQTASNSSTVYSLPPTVSPTSPLYTDLLVHNLFHTFSCLAVGQSVIGQPCLTYQISQNAQGMIQGVPVLSSVNTTGGVLGTTTSLIGALYDNRPVTTVDYLASINLGIAKEANAQVFGSGAAVLNPILTLWQTSRNISYVIMIIIFIIIGLMIMFRNKINPQTVITAQAALPGLVIGLIMITFSYFFAGLISDMAYIGTNIVGYYFVAAQGKLNDTDFAGQINLVQTIKDQNVLNLFSYFTGIVDPGKATGSLNAIWTNLSDGAQRLLTALAVFVTAQTTSQATELLKAIPVAGAGIQAAIVGVASLGTLSFPTDIVGLVLSFIATAVLLYAMFKLLLRLVTAYLNIIFLTITAPFQFLAAVLPGRQGIATGWMLNMLANVLAFPAILAVFYFVAFILPDQSFGPFKVAQLENNQSNNFTPTIYAQGKKNSIVGNATFPLFGGVDLDIVKMLLAFGALIAMPSIPDIITRSIGKVSQAGQLIGQEIGGSTGQGQKYAGQFQQGVGSASGQLAQARGLFGSPAYMPTGFDEHGNPTGWMINPNQYQPSFRQKLFARGEARKGNIKPLGS